MTTDTMTRLETCEYCQQETEDFTHIRVNIIRHYTLDESIERIRRSYIDAYGPLTENQMQHAHQYMRTNWHYSEAERTVCMDCAKVCQWCDDLYVEPGAIDNTFDSDEHMRFARLRWNHIDTLCYGCADDAYTCDRCNIAVHGDYRCTTEDDWTFCDDCYQEAYFCEECECTYGDRDHARSCRSTPRRVHNYGYKPDPEFQSIVEVDGDLSDYQKLAATPFLGAELEIEVPEGDMNEALDIVESAFGRKAYCKEDGSIEYGFEIVTHPMTLEAHKRLVDWSFANRLSEIGCRSWNTRTCGLHVHISRSAFRGNLHMVMFQHLIINNDVEMARLAGRSSDRWASFHGIREDIQKRVKGQAYAARYEAVNTLPEETIEVRMFKGSLKPERILMALELVDAAFHYTKHIGTHAYIATDRLHFFYFAQWVSGNEKYPNLNQYINHYQLTNNVPPSMAQVDGN